MGVARIGLNELQADAPVGHALLRHVLPRRRLQDRHGSSLSYLDHRLQEVTGDLNLTRLFGVFVCLRVVVLEHCEVDAGTTVVVAHCFLRKGLIVVLRVLQVPLALP